MAERLGIDPVTMRLRNCLRDGARLPTQSVVPGGVSLPELIEACARESGCEETPDGWVMPKAQRGTGKRRGYGLAVAMRHSGIGYGFPDASTARVTLRGEAEIERAEIHTAAADVGQGAHTVLAQIAAEALGIPLGKVQMTTGDTGTIGEAGTASASRLTIFAGNAVKRAAEKALAEWLEEVRPAVGEFRWESPKTTPPDPETGACTEHHSYSYAAEAVEVEVDPDTGEVDLKKVAVAQDPGRAVNPQMLHGQIKGAVVQAQGWALLEDFATQRGYVLTDQFSTYLIPTVADIPEEVKSILLELPDPLGPYGVRGAGEIPFVPLAPAILSAVHDALGIWFDSLPLRPERILQGLGSLES
jgi:CO/xanthine dehydrogenase Mo-binding subunit